GLDDLGPGHTQQVVADARTLREAALLVQGHAQLAAREGDGVAGPAAVDPHLRAPRAAQGFRGVEVDLGLASDHLRRLAQEADELPAVGVGAFLAGAREPLVRAGPGAGDRA